MNKESRFDENNLARKTGLCKNTVGIVYYKDIKSYANDWFVSKNFVLYSLFYSDKYFVREYDLLIWHRLFITLDEPRSCRLAYLWSIIILCVTLISSILYIVSSTQQSKIAPDSCDFPVCSYDADLCPNKMICEPDTLSIMVIIEDACVYVFSIDYFLRVLTSGTVPSRIAGMIFDDFEDKELTEINLEFIETKEIKEFDKKYPWYSQIIMYALKPLNIIDFIAILPYYMSLNGNTMILHNNLTVLRVFRLGRIFRLVKVVKNTIGVQLIAKTIYRALDALGILIFLSCIGVVVFASLFDFIEKGEYTVDSLTQNGGYVRSNAIGKDELSPFQSIPVGIYYAVVTMCTVGYGDIVPTTQGGRILACLFMYCGVLILALPISVLGNNFDRLCDETRGGAAEILAAAISEIMECDIQEDGEELIFKGNLLDGDKVKRKNIEDYVSQNVSQQVQTLTRLATMQARKLCSIAVVSKGLMDADSLNSRKLSMYLMEIGIERTISALEAPGFSWESNARHLFFPDRIFNNNNPIEALGEEHIRDSLFYLYDEVRPKLSKKEKIITKSVRARKRSSIGLNAFGKITSDDEEVTKDMINPNERLYKPRSNLNSQKNV